MLVMAGSALGVRIRKRRQVLGMTQQELADKLHVAKSTVANWERGKHFPLRYLGAVEVALGIDLDPDAARPPIDPRLQRMIDGLTPEEKAHVIEQLTGMPYPVPDPDPPPREQGEARDQAGLAG